ncbi:MAG: T9SS type A sorting domain-containing protein [Bacteroidales bacterium]|nr:T9SS type A sorting domain-containing protein [Bacteroidales bacterium]
MLSDPGLIFLLDMYEVENWLRPDTYRTEIAAGASVNIPYTVDAANLANGTNREATMRILFDPAIPAHSQKIKVNVNGKATLAKPTGLTATVQNDEKAVLTWTAADAPTAPASYNIYRDGEKIGSATALTYTDNNLKAGLYRYEVSAVYAGGESKKSDVAEAEIVVGIACYKPHDLKARNVRNEEIVLSWDNPSEVGATPTALTWSNGHVYDYINMRDNSVIIGASQWTPEELADYRNMRISAVTFVPTTSDFADVPSNGVYTVYIWEDGEVKYKQSATNGFKRDEPYTMTLDKPYTINDRKTLRVGVEASGCYGIALGIDDGPAKVGKGDWIYNAENLDGWITLHAAGSANGNFIISLDLLPKAQPETNTAKSYNVFRNGVKINTEPVTGTTYTDKPEAGNYIYTVTAVHDNCESYASNAVKGRIVDLKSHDAPEDLAASVKLNRDVQLNWNYPNYKLSGETKAGYAPFAYVTNMTLPNSAEASVVTDGQYIYTSFYNRVGEFNKYDLNGTFIETFKIEGISQMLDLTWDGQYFYGGKGTTELYCLDFENHTLVKTMTVTDAVRHCTYIPELDNGRGGFEIGDWTTSYFVSREGLYLNSGYQSPVGAFGSAYHDGKLYYFQQHTGALCELIEVDFATLTATGNRADLNLYSQYKVSSEARAGGLGLFTSLNGSAMLLANIQNGNQPNQLVWVEATPNEFVSGFNLYRDNKKVNSEPLTDREYHDVLTTPGTYAYTVSAIFLDGVEGDKTAPVNVKIVEPKHCEAPVNVKAVVTDRDVRLQWTVALEDEVAKDDIEYHTHLKPVSNYITVDADNQPTYVPDDWTYADAGKPSSFLVLDQRALTPAQKNLSFSGNKVIGVFGAVPAQGVDVAYANDWLIMPAATQTGGETQWISFMARGLDIDTKESFRVAYSMTDPDTVDFVRVSQKNTYVNGVWSRYTFELPANIKYVAIEYTSANGKVLLIDDISVGSGACVFELDESLDASETFVEKVAGYTVLRDNKPLMTDPVHANTYFDGNLPNGTYYYTVKATYNTSCVSATSEPIAVKVDFKAPQKAPSNLNGAQRRTTDTVDLSWNAPKPVSDKSISYVMSAMEDVLGFTTASLYYIAQKWEPSDLLGVYGYQIEAVNAFIAYAPNQIDLLIYQDDELVYEQTVTRMCEDLDVSTFVLDEPFVVDYSKSLTVGFRIDADEMSFTIGYDGGPAMDGGDLFSYDGVNWRSGNYALGAGNWYMAVIMSMPEPAGGYDTGFKGYLVYRDGQAVRKELISDTKFIDHGLENGIHTYAVSAVYEDGEQMSKNISVRVLKVANEDLDENNLYLFPNPTSDFFTVYGTFTQIEITDLQGKVQLKHEASQGAEVSVATLSPGVYFVRIASEAGATVRKLVVK